MISLKTLVEENKTSGEKLTREVFIYLNPKGDKKKFAQCGTCRMFTGTGCTILGKTKITANMSCNFYVNGPPTTKAEGKEESIMSPKEVGLVDRQVRCENCRSFKNGICLLYQSLNQYDPDIYDLDEKVDSLGCCNANKPR